MGEASDGQDSREFLAGIRIGDLCTGTVTEVTRSQGVTVTLDGFSASPLGTIWPSDVSWEWNRSAAVEVGQRITAEVIAVELDEGHARLSLTAAESPELWTFLRSRHRGEILSGTIAAIERFGVFVALDDGPGHPVLPGVGFITIPEPLRPQHQAAVLDGGGPLPYLPSPTASSRTSWSWLPGRTPWQS
ncbi:hypothetical protein [Streptomyces sp. NPDC002403]